MPSFGNDVFAPRKWRRGWREYLASSLGVVWIEFSGAGASNNGLQKQCLPRKTADVLVDDFKAVVGKLRQSYKNLNVNNVGIFGQGLGAHVALRLLNKLSSDDVSLNCTLLLSPITNI